MLTTGLLIGGAGGAIASAEPESTGSTTQSQGVDQPTAGIAAANSSSPTTSHTPKYPIRTAIQDVLKKLRTIGQPATKPSVAKPTTTPVIPDADTDAPEATTPVADDPAVAPETGSAPADTNPTPPATPLAATESTAPAPPSNVVPPALSAVQPITNAVATVAGVALSVPGVVAGLPASEDPVGDVIASMTTMLATVNDAVAPLAQVPGDLYSLFVVAGMTGAPTVPVATGSGLGQSAAAGAGLTSPTPPSASPFTPTSPIEQMSLLNNVAPPATLGGIAATGLRADLAVSGTTPMTTEAAAPASALSLLENTVKAVLAPASLSALAAFALPGLGGLLVICAAGMRVGYRQAKAALAVRSTVISRFARQGPLGVVRTGSLVAVHSRQQRKLRAVRPGMSRVAPALEQAA